MRIVYCAPGLGPCGGARVIVEHVNRLKKRGHDVMIASHQSGGMRWIRCDVPMIRPELLATAKAFDAVVATGWQTVEMARALPARKLFYFVQMMEDHFYTERSKAYFDAARSYVVAKDAGFRFVTIARWLQRTLRENCDVSSVIVPNGINEDHFHPDGSKRDVILVEGDDRNPAKDVDHLSWRVALKLKERYGVELWGYAAVPNQYASQFDRFVLRPTTTQMRMMYSAAKLMVKASRYEGRSLAPLEAFACGTTCARALIEGDDDLVDGQNCRRTPYIHEKLYLAADQLMSDSKKLALLTAAASSYAKRNLQWEPIIDTLEAIYEA